MIDRVAFCPHPPLLVPGVGGVIDHPGIAEVRRAAFEVVADALTREPTAVTVLVGACARAAKPAREAAAWLLQQAGWAGPTSVCRTTAVPDWGVLARDDSRHLILAMADGTAKRAESAPGYYDERAEVWDADAVAALAAVDAEALAGIDARLAHQLWVQAPDVLIQAGCLARALDASGARLQAKVAYDRAPLGVEYWVATWQVATG